MDDSRKTAFVFGTVLILVIVLALITYLFFWNENAEYGDADLPPIEVSETIPPIRADSNNAENLAPLPDSAPLAIEGESVASVDSTPPSVEVPSVAPSVPSANTANTISQLKYTIKPLDRNISTCTTMRNAKWDMPQSCRDDIFSSVQNLINTNNELIALEVSGIVDNNPYSGPSAELKQEGLASFRAREAIIAITRAFSEVAVFEGLSQQSPGKRGFEIKAYYLQK